MSKEQKDIQKDLSGVGREDPASLYVEWIKSEAQKINSDGCTAVSEWNKWCCFEHDLGCHYKKDPRKAFELYLYGLSDVWAMAPEMSRREADKRFAKCNLSNARDLVGFVRTGIRYIGVRIGALWPF